MKVVLILTSLCLIGLFASNPAHALLLATPLELWESNQIIIDGTVIAKTVISSEKLIQYDIEVNQYFKNAQKSKLITIYGPSEDDTDFMYPKYFDVGEKVLFYLNNINGKYKISPYSVKSTPECSPRDSIGLSTLPSEPIGRGGPTLFFDPYQKCNPYLPSAEYLKSTLPPLKQIKSGIKMHDVGCKEIQELVFRPNGDNAVCVKPETKIKLIERGWSANGPEPTARITPISGFFYVDDEIEFSSIESKSGNNKITSYEWDFGDDETNGHDQIIHHSFKQAGTYTVVLTVQDSDGNTDRDKVTVTIEPNHNLAK